MLAPGPDASGLGGYPWSRLPREQSRTLRRAYVARRQVRAALRAAQVAVDLAAAIAVLENDRGTGVGRVAVAPLEQRHQDGPEVDPLLRQPVLVARRAFLVELPAEDPLLDEPFEPRL